MPFHHGVSVNEINTGARPVRRASTSVLGMVATASDANAAAFPMNTPVLVTDLDAAIEDAGVLGTLATSLEAVRDQCSPLVVVVRVDDSGDNDADLAAKLAGLNKLVEAENVVGVRPRILGAPGLETTLVTNTLAAIARKLRGFAYAYAYSSTTIGELVTYRETFAQRELMLIWPSFTRGNVSMARTVARAMSLRARIDAEQGVQKSLSNVAVEGVTGISRPVFFDLQDPTCEAVQINMNDVTTLVRMNGFRFWGSRTCSDDPLFAFEPTVRVAHFLRDTIAGAMAWAVDKPIGPGLASDIVEMINAEFRSYKSEGIILGGEAWLDKTVNTVGAIKSGKLTIDYDFTVPPPLEDLSLNQRITDKYIATAFGGAAG